ncbi:DUF979 domain-containing protein [Companilactobacillus kimchii]|uniref:Permease n=2 Tax=Companilactobacillus kimchii TaxID=2801452 RepID=A0ABR5NUJ4_9LACO|nr:DUF979 domain-containing protein [Companilactobacillus kimchii]KAE9557342.1 hypothetical protein ATN91_04140 [Companilactobacillus kimchii]KRK52447.1 hypothetical protein FC97_GL000249 [Companilactobacillus kimchii DSM 13961 = JCM 10707]OWF32564.1 hypothetical protein LKACC12383_01787 [Companilactobacillus kimchii]GEO47365.1 permease [Companilactobacillus paralimentarius]
MNVNNILEIFYVLIGLIMVFASIESFRDRENSARIGTGLFWLIMGIIFAVGKYLPNLVIGLLIVFVGILSLLKQIKVGKLKEVNKEIAEKSAKRLGAWLFFPSVVLAIFSILISQFTKLGGQVGIGIASVIALIIAMIISKTDAKTTYHDSERMVRSVGTAGVLPQLLATLGVIFTASGVGDVTSKAISGVFPAGNHLLGVILYCVAMVIFTMVMGNAFAAFAVITAGIGIPFVVAQGGNPAVVAALGMTSGYCGTLMTPMAANFNSLPVALLEMKDNLGVIKQQFPIALTLLVVQIILMYFLAF